MGTTKAIRLRALARSLSVLATSLAASVSSSSDAGLVQVTSTGGGSVSLIGAPGWFHNDVSGSCPDGGTWLPSVSLAYPSTDSFLTIGLPADDLPNFTIENPFLMTSPGCAPTLGPNAGWINSNPTSLQGFASNVLLSNATMLESATMIGRFTVAGPLDSSAAINLTNFKVTYGPSFSPPSLVSFDDVTFSYVPGPAAALPLLLLAVAGARGSRRRKQLANRLDGQLTIW
jgi:hypothetical protein